MPSNDSERLEKIREKKAQLEKQERAIMNREKQRLRKEDTRRKIIIGGIVMSYFPECKNLTPRRTDKENEAEFAPLAHFLSRLAKTKDIVEWLKSDD